MRRKRITHSDSRVWRDHINGRDYEDRPEQTGPVTVRRVEPQPGLRERVWALKGYARRKDDS